MMERECYDLSTVQSYQKGRFRLPKIFLRIHEDAKQEYAHIRQSQYLIANENLEYIRFKLLLLRQRRWST